MRHFLVFCFGIIFSTNLLIAQLPKKSSTSDIYHSVQKLNFLGTALYIAAHPDDENTRLISYLSNEVKARTAYLSMTRGDGGQNLIGTELRELLGVLRTEELLAARRIDGGEQFFTRANDFGYSKHPDETLEIWNKKAVLGDVVWAIRTLKPDVIINRFDHRSPGSTHGHHTSSAMLSVEAFDLASDQSAYASQLSLTDTWQPKRLFFNTSWWFYGSEENFRNADKSKMLSLDVGVYYPLMGLSNNEIASMASSQHLCQGFGRVSSRGSENEYIELLKGDLPKNKDNIFDGIDTSWSRVKGGKAIGELLYGVENNFNFKDPSQHLPQLLAAYKLLQNISDEHWKAIKTLELEEVIANVLGLYLEASSEETDAVPGSKITIDVEALKRSKADLKLNSVSITGNATSLSTNIPLKTNIKENFKIDFKIPENTNYTSPYWLAKKGSLGMYTVDDQELIGRAETPIPFMATFHMAIEGTPIALKRPVVHHYSKPDKGELYEPFEVLPEITARINDKVIIFSDSNSKDIPVQIRAGRDNVAGKISLSVPPSWKVTPSEIDFSIAQKGDENTVHFKVTPPNKESEGEITPKVTIDKKVYSQELVIINYDHIPRQSVLLPASIKAVRLNIQKAGENIGYIMGAGDDVPKSLEQIGYKVFPIDLNEVQEGTLANYDAIVVGIRAYNVVDALRFKQRYLLDYVKNGGNLIIQYNTSGRSGLDFPNLAPYPLTVSRDRVTDENSPVTILANNHPLVNVPNQITENDFKGWVQERGLYFPNEWGKEFTPILSMHDKGESATQGSLLVAPYGKGNYIYTGLSFFRELPEGVAGAYKLFANMLSLGKTNSNLDNTPKN
ncbi:PIG-L family deacetylase [Sediminicola sp. 1XM1-17]|uniref:PIG-L family deacetylase n=1 Tax=Sediminicola sp. 1XM1-17 TaxID=3127702 RepID=UPI0030783E2B